MMSASTSRTTTSNNNNNSSTKTDIYHGDDHDDIDDNDKYSKIKTSNNRLSRKVFAFIALAYTIAAYVCLVNSSSSSNTSSSNTSTATTNTRRSSSNTDHTSIASDVGHNAATTSTSSRSSSIASDVKYNAGTHELQFTSSTTDDKDTNGDYDDTYPSVDADVDDKLVADYNAGIDELHSASTTDDTNTDGGGEYDAPNSVDVLEDEDLVTDNWSSAEELTKNEQETKYLEKTSLENLEEKRIQLDKIVRDRKATGILMETDETSLTVTKSLQKITRTLLTRKYGDCENYRVKVELEFQSTIPDFDTNGPNGTLVIEMAPISLLPVSVYNFLEIARTWQHGAFHRNADHVLQATTHATDVTQPLSFQEYSEEYPHTKGTVGYCGRPSGPCWYINIIDNTENHGRGSQQDKNPHEADANFGRIVEGLEDVVPRIHSVPQKEWLDKENQVLIKTMTILVPRSGGGDDADFVEWKPSL